MTIDERLEKLTERHEALTQAVELMQREFKAEFEKEHLKLSLLVSTVDGLVKLSQSHEARLDRLEGR